MGKVSETPSVALPARATAGTGNPTLTTGDAPDSICPSAWRLPGWEGKKSYVKLARDVYVEKNRNAWNSIQWLRMPYQMSPISFNGAGYAPDSSASLLGGSINYWTSTKVDASTAKDFNVNALPYPPSSHSSGAGLSLRCLAR